MIEELANHMICLHFVNTLTLLPYYSRTFRIFSEDIAVPPNKFNSTLKIGRDRAHSILIIEILLPSDWLKSIVSEHDVGQTSHGEMCHIQQLISNSAELHSVFPLTKAIFTFIEAKTVYSLFAIHR